MECKEIVAKRDKKWKNRKLCDFLWKLETLKTLVREKKTLKVFKILIEFQQFSSKASVESFNP